MNNSKLQASIDTKKLADSLRGKFQTLYTLPQDCCIYRVPQPTRCLNPSDYTPQIISIGPLHHGKKELKAMEENKIIYLQHFLQRTKVSIEEFLALIKDKEAKLRNCYAETIELKSDDFVTIILLDAAFLIEFLMRSGHPELKTSGDPIFEISLWRFVWMDIWLVENQLPLFILNELFILAKTTISDEHSERLFVTTINRAFFNTISLLVSIEKNDLLENHFLKAKHLLDLLRLYVQSSAQSSSQDNFIPLNIPNVTELHRAGVKFKVGPSNKLFSITFNKGILEIPCLRIFIETQSLFRNLQTFETLHCDTHHVNDYVVIMNYLVNTSKDVELLVQNQVIKNWLTDSEAVSTLFRELVKGTPMHRNFQYSDLVEDLDAYCKRPWHRWKAILKQNYFNGPWASISVIAAVFLLVLTFIQTTCSIIAL